MSLSEQVKQFDALLQRDEPVLALAPMQDVTDLPFWKVIRSRGGADLYYTCLLYTSPSPRDRG